MNEVFNRLEQYDYDKRNCGKTEKVSEISKFQVLALNFKFFDLTLMDPVEKNNYKTSSLIYFIETQLYSSFRAITVNFR